MNTFFLNAPDFFSRKVQISRLPPFDSAGVSLAIKKKLRSKLDLVIEIETDKVGQRLLKSGPKADQWK